MIKLSLNRTSQKLKGEVVSISKSSDLMGHKARNI